MRRTRSVTTPTFPDGVSRSCPILSVTGGSQKNTFSSFTARPVSWTGFIDLVAQDPRFEGHDQTFAESMFFMGQKTYVGTLHNTAGFLNLWTNTRPQFKYTILNIHSCFLGVTGPYMFAISLGTYMSSKEVFVYEHDFYCGLAFWAAMITLVNVAGPGVTKSLDTVSSS